MAVIPRLSEATQAVTHRLAPRNFEDWMGSTVWNLFMFIILLVLVFAIGCVLLLGLGGCMAAWEKSGLKCPSCACCWPISRRGNAEPAVQPNPTVSQEGYELTSQMAPPAYPGTCSNCQNSHNQQPSSDSGTAPVAVAAGTAAVLGATTVAVVATSDNPESDAHQIGSDTDSMADDNESRQFLNDEDYLNQS